MRSTDTEGQKTSRTRKEGRQQRHKTESDAAQSTRSQKQEEKTNREAAETKKQSVLPPEVSHLYCVMQRDHCGCCFQSD